MESVVSNRPYNNIRAGRLSRINIGLPRECYVTRLSRPNCFSTSVDRFTTYAFHHPGQDDDRCTNEQPEEIGSEQKDEKTTREIRQESISK